RRKTSASCEATCGDHGGSSDEEGGVHFAMSDTIQRRLEEVMALLPCPVSGCWGLHGAETSYYHDTDAECHVLEVWPVAVEEPVEPETNGHEGAEPEILYDSTLALTPRTRGCESR